MTDRKQQKIRNGGNTAWMKKQNRKQNRCAGWNPCHSHRMVVWFHFWQQTWLTPYLRIPTEYTKYIGLTEINLAGWVRYGFVFVDMMILLSAFCNFYPYARSIVLGEDWPDTKRFYRKRAARILPSYYFMLTIDLVFYILPWHKYRNVGALCKDIVTHVFALHQTGRTLIYPPLLTVCCGRYRWK